MPVFQRSWVRFPAHLSGGLQSSVTPASEHEHLLKLLKATLQIFVFILVVYFEHFFYRFFTYTYAFQFWFKCIFLCVWMCMFQHMYAFLVFLLTVFFLMCLFVLFWFVFLFFLSWLRCLFVRIQTAIRQSEGKMKMWIWLGGKVGWVWKELGEGRP